MMLPSLQNWTLFGISVLTFATHVKVLAIQLLVRIAFLLTQNMLEPPTDSFCRSMSRDVQITWITSPKYITRLVFKGENTITLWNVPSENDIVYDGPWSSAPSDFINDPKSEWLETFIWARYHHGIFLFKMVQRFYVIFGWIYEVFTIPRWIGF